MTIEQEMQQATTIIRLSGRLDTSTAPQLEAKLRDVLKETKELVLDFETLEYISSAGLRVLLAAQKQMNAKNGIMKVRNACESIMEVFEITGFTDILSIE